MNPWFNRGSNISNGTGAGVFTFANGNGYAARNDSFRVITMLTNNSK